MSTLEHQEAVYATNGTPPSSPEKSTDSKIPLDPSHLQARLRDLEIQRNNLQVEMVLERIWHDTEEQRRLIFENGLGCARAEHQKLVNYYMSVIQQQDTTRLALHNEIQIRDSIITDQKLRILELETICDIYQSQNNPPLHENPIVCNPNEIQRHHDYYTPQPHSGYQLGIDLNKDLHSSGGLMKDAYPNNEAMSAQQVAPAYNSLPIESLLQPSNNLPPVILPLSEATKRGADSQEPKKAKRQRKGSKKGLEAAQQTNLQ